MEGLRTVATITTLLLGIVVLCGLILVAIQWVLDYVIRLRKMMPFIAAAVRHEKELKSEKSRLLNSLKLCETEKAKHSEVSGCGYPRDSCAICESLHKKKWDIQEALNTLCPCHVRYV